MSEHLDPLTLPLWGSRLIEASAGTGKTWTIAALYVRLVLGHGGGGGFLRPLLPGRILVLKVSRGPTPAQSKRGCETPVGTAACFWRRGARGEGTLGGVH